MSTPCDWVASRLGAVGTGGGTAIETAIETEDPKLLAEVHAHALTCAACARELAAYETVDRLLGADFAARMALASRPPVRKASRLLIAVAAAAALLLAVWIGVAWNSSVLPSESVAGPVIGDLEDSNSLAKPSEKSAAAVPDLPGGETAAASDESFSVIDAAGYAHTLADYEGSVVVLAVFDAAGTGGQTFRDIYQTVPAQSGLSFLAIREASAPGPGRDDLEGLPVMVNQGSRLLGIRPGELAVLDREGRIHSRVSLSGPGSEAGSAVQSALAELGLASE